MNVIQINTAQNVKIDFPLASLADRGLAFAVDMLVILGYFFVVDKLFLKIIPFRDLDNWTRWAIYSLIFSPVFLYSLIFEILLNGQTPGKKILRIKVVKKDGYAPSFTDIFIRWFFRIVDIWLMGFTPVVGIISIATSRFNQRIGDLAAGTVVIKTGLKDRVDYQTIEKTEKQSYIPQFPGVIKLSDKDMRVIRRVMEQTTNKDNAEMLAKLRRKVEEIIGSFPEDLSDREFLEKVIHDYVYYTKDM